MITTLFMAMITHRFTKLSLVLAGLLLPASARATGSASLPDLTGGAIGWLAVAVFVVAYAVVISEEFTELRKSKPVIVAAGVIWVLVAIAYAGQGRADEAATLLRHNLLEYAEIMLFLLSAMTFINTLEERSVFRRCAPGWCPRDSRCVPSTGSPARSPFYFAVRRQPHHRPHHGVRRPRRGWRQQKVCGSFMYQHRRRRQRRRRLQSVRRHHHAHGVAKGVVKAEEFLALFLPALVNWLVPAALMAFAVPAGKPAVVAEHAAVKRGGYVVIALFLLTIALTVALHHYLHLPPFLGMMTGLGILKVYGYFIRRHEVETEPEIEVSSAPEGFKPAVKPFDIFISMKRVEWDTLMFFYGVVLCVGGLGALGYLAAMSQSLYGDLGATTANVLIGVASAVIDNIPIMYAVLNMNPDMSLGQWLLVTLTAGVGGSLLSIGSAAGVGLMGQARGTYTFFSHLKWTWAIALGYAASIWVHLHINNAKLF